MIDTIVKKSKVEGLGVFALRNFKKGEVVIKWDISQQLTPKSIKKIPEKDKRYVAHFNGKFILMQPPARFVNHSCDANTYANNFCDIAKRDIKKGEEITGDYSEEAISGEIMVCKCGSKNCRSIMKAY
ncbi:SET domain-containing protein-lysine N-methyltransferase [Candidatus Woesearchaeota archaeon]|nr:SET domain-containing protein-lysine N-methyltransferase [Candidatus Woesearchaeota archaeon]